jgi:hypothetical protein
MAPTPAQPPSLVAQGFQLTVGSVLAMMIFLALGMLLFIPGFLIVRREQAKPKDQQSTGVKVVGYMLMILGAVVALGLGFGAILSTLMEEL